MISRDDARRKKENLQKVWNSKRGDMKLSFGDWYASSVQATADLYEANPDLAINDDLQRRTDAIMESLPDPRTEISENP